MEEWLSLRLPAAFEALSAQAFNHIVGDIGTGWTMSRDEKLHGCGAIVREELEI